MGARGYFRLIAVLITVLTVGTAVLVLVLPPEHRSWTYLAIQLCAIAVILLLVILYRKTVKPLGTLSEGIDLLKEQDFSTRLRQVGQADADRIIELFNRMSRQLHEEEVRAQEQNHFLELLIAASPMGVLIMDIVSGAPHRCIPDGRADHGYRRENILRQSGHVPLPQPY